MQKEVLFFGFPKVKIQSFLKFFKKQKKGYKLCKKQFRKNVKNPYMQKIGKLYVKL